MDWEVLTYILAAYSIWMTSNNFDRLYVIKNLRREITELKEEKK